MERIYLYVSMCVAALGLKIVVMEAITNKKMVPRCFEWVVVANA